MAIKHRNRAQRLRGAAESSGSDEIEDMLTGGGLRAGVEGGMDFADPEADPEGDNVLMGDEDDLGSPHSGADEHQSLTSQSLNADGTPKRPMNAFMIFARRRRPQVSAANQMMRTGEISKILSREWNAMVMADKQFYLDQAKKLKDAFNSKYPDYVYRRRPNNSRRKRKHDALVGRNPIQSGVIHHPEPQDSMAYSPDRDIVRVGGSPESPVSPISHHPPHGHLGYNDQGHVVVHSPGQQSHPNLSLSGAGSTLQPYAGGNGSLAPPSAYGSRPSAPYTPITQTASSGSEGAPQSSLQNQQGLSPLSPLSPYTHPSHGRYTSSSSTYSPVTPATGSSAGFGGGYEFGGSSEHAQGNQRFFTDYQHQQQHSAYPHSPSDPTPHPWANGPRDSSTTGSWPGVNVQSNLPARSRPYGSMSSLGSSVRHLGQNGQGYSQGEGGSKDNFSGIRSTGGRERAYSATPSNASASSASPGNGGTSAATGNGPMFPTLTEAYRPGQPHGRSPSNGSPSLTRGSGGDVDVYDNSHQQGSYPLSPMSPPSAVNTSQGAPSGGSLYPPSHAHGPRAAANLLHPLSISPYGTHGGHGQGQGPGSPRDGVPHIGQREWARGDEVSRYPSRSLQVVA